MKEHDLSGIKAAAAQVGAQADEHEAAIDAERSAEAEVLEAAIAAARPAIRAVCSRILSRETTTGIADVNKQRTDRAWHAQRGLVLEGAKSAERDQPRDNQGSYQGRALVLLETGELAELEWSGRWTKWQGGTDECTSTLEGVSARDAMDRWTLDDCLESLRKAIEGQLTGKAPERAKAARERAAKLEAIARLAK